MAQHTQALAVTGKAQSVLDEAPIDPRLVMAAKAIQLMAGQNDDGTSKISADMALAAAMYQAGPGQLLGRDFYVNDKVGRMEGYRGVARDANERGIGEVQIKYRPLTADEAQDHEIQAGDTAVACEVYQLRAWNMAQRMGQRYDPIVGIGVIRKVEKYDKKSVQRWNDKDRRYVQLPESEWRLTQLEGGMTWRKKAQNRAYKDALRHTPGMPVSADEILEEATINGMTELPPEGARLTMDQAQAWVAEHGVSGNNEPDGVTEGEFTEQSDHPGFAVWADWKNMHDAKRWAMTQGKFNANEHMERAYAKVKSETQPKTPAEMWQAWYEYVTAHAPAITNAELDGKVEEKPPF